MIRPRKSVEHLQKYRPPLEGRGGKMRLDFNENTVGCAPEVVRALRRALSSEMLTRYPEYDASRRTLAEYFGVAPEEMLLTNGTDDAIKMLCDTFVDPGEALLVPAPTFPVYEFFHNVAGGSIVRVRYDENFRLPLGEILAALKKKVRWLALANPNNPTGTQIPKSDLRAILEAAPQTLVLVDEAYYDFSGETVLPWIRKYPNLAVTRTFSKAFGLAALRMGYLFAKPELTEVLHRAQNPFAVNSLALAAACVAIEHEDYVRKYAGEIRANRAEFCRWLDAREIPYVPSAANFVLTRVGERAPDIAKRLRAEGILVRDWSYDPHLKGYLRFTIGAKAQTRRLTEELQRLEHLMDTRDGTRAWKNFVTYSQTGWFA
ncbi:MAG: histidinol-phosphate transaminase [Acidobacteriia bacterium]|nr:histidinol-phosphate transaminase [Terriglobia bacterium]